jgi:hypothetical protein
MGSTLAAVCPTCKRPLLPDAMSPPGPANLECEECPERASFIQHGRALCFKHASKSLQEPTRNVG